MYILCLITCKVRSENGYGFLRPGLKMGVGNGIFWSEIGSGFGEAGGKPPPKIPRSTSPPRDFTEGLPPVVSSYDFNLISANVGMFKVVFALNASQNSY